MNHPNIVSAQYADQVDRIHFLVMEYVAGRTLTQRVQDGGPLPIAEACDYVRQTAAALAHAHAHGLVHRDLKPSNVLVTPTGQVKLLDLGLAQLQDDFPAGEAVTALGHALGTPDYMAPEQWDNAHAVDIRADLYSLGCTFYYLLAGQPPYSGAEHSSRTRKMKAHLAAPVPAIRAARPDVPPAVAAVLQRLLAKDPAQRYQTPADVSAALEQLAQEPHPEAALPTQWYVPAGAAPGRAEMPPAVLSGQERRSKRIRFRLSLGCVSITIALAFSVLIVASGVLTIPSLERVGSKTPAPGPLAVEDSTPPSPMFVVPPQKAKKDEEDAIAAAAQKQAAYQAALLAGQKASAAKNYADAIKAYTEAARLMPDDVNATALLQQAQRDDEAARERKQLKTQLALKDRAKDKLDKGTPTKGTGDKQKVDQQRKTQFAALLKDGNAKLQDKRYAEAISVFQEALKLYPNDARRSSVSGRQFRPGTIRRTSRRR